MKGPETSILDETSHGFVCVCVGEYDCVYATDSDLLKEKQRAGQLWTWGKYTMDVLPAHNSKIQQYYCELGYVHFPWK